MRPPPSPCRPSPPHEQETALLGAQTDASALAQSESSDNLSLVKNIPYQARYGAVANYGTDIEFATVGGRKYAFAGSYKNGMQIVDISDPWLLLRPRRSALATGRQAERPARQGGEHLLLVEDRPALIGPHP